MEKTEKEVPVSKSTELNSRRSQSKKIEKLPDEPEVETEPESERKKELGKPGQKEEEELHRSFLMI